MSAVMTTLKPNNIALKVEDYDVSWQGLLFERQTVVSHLQHEVVL